MKLIDLLKRWKNSYPELDTAWFESCCGQILRSLRREVPVIRLVPLTAIGGDSKFVMVVSRVHDFPSESKTIFDIHFYNLTDPRAIPVTSKMRGKDTFFSKNLGDTPPKCIKLTSLLGELTKLALNRVPLFNEDSHPMYMIHRSMIDQYIVKTLSAGDGKSIDELTLADLLGEPSMKKMFESTFAVVSKKATLADASNAMHLMLDCRDVFITETGKSDEPVIGWLTNIRIAELG